MSTHAGTALAEGRPGSSPLALVLEGGGARAAWQVGALRGLAHELPDLQPTIQVGVSAGAINAAFLANQEGTLAAAVQGLSRLWGGLDTSGVFATHPTGLVSRLLRVGLRLALGLESPGEPILGMVDTKPLRRTLERGLMGNAEAFEGLRRNLESGRLRALALLTTRYATGQTVCFFEGQGVTSWDRPQRLGKRARLGVEHVLASAALPLFFPPVEVAGDWYGDGGVRLVAPLAPAVHLGAERILALSTRYARTAEEAAAPRASGPPSPALIAGNLFNAVFLDSLDQDAAHLERINRLLAAAPQDEVEGLRPVALAMLRPSEDLGLLAARFEPELPWMFRRLLRNLGTGGEDSQDLLSTVLFEPGYLHALLELGERDGRSAAPRVAEALGLGSGRGVGERSQDPA